MEEVMVQLSQLQKESEQIYLKVHLQRPKNLLVDKKCYTFVKDVGQKQFEKCWEVEKNPSVELVSLFLKK